MINMDEKPDDSHLLNLPSDLRRKILLEIPIKELYAIAGVSGSYGKMIRDDGLWRILLQRDLPNVSRVEELCIPTLNLKLCAEPHYFAYLIIRKVINYIVYDLGPRYLVINLKYIDHQALDDDIYQSLQKFINDVFGNPQESEPMLRNYSEDLSQLMSGLSKIHWHNMMKSNFFLYGDVIQIREDLRIYLKGLGLFNNPDLID